MSDAAVNVETQPELHADPVVHEDENSNNDNNINESSEAGALQTVQMDRDGEPVICDVETLHVGDYVAFESITPQKDWRISLGKVLALPSEHTVRLARYDAVNAAALTRDPITEENLYRRAERENRLDIWHDREALREELDRVIAREKETAVRLFAAREQTRQRRTAAEDAIAAAIERLDAARTALATIPARQWRDARSRADLPLGVLRLLQAVLLVLREEGADQLDRIQAALRAPDFMERLLAWDCSETPMSLARRRRVVELCALEQAEETQSRSHSSREGGARASKKKRAASSSSSAPAATPSHNAGELVLIPDMGDQAGAYAGLDKALRGWLNAQLNASAVARQRERTLDECFTSLQEQRVLLGEVNDARVRLSSLQVQMREAKNAIMGYEDAPEAIMPLEAYATDTDFYRCYREGTAGQMDQVICLREQVLLNLGPVRCEDVEGYVRLNERQAEALRNVTYQANVRHDADEMQQLLEQKDLEEAELKELHDLLAELNARPALSAEEEEERTQLEQLIEDAQRRHVTTLTRIADLYAAGRGAREITLAGPRSAYKYTRLHCKMSGDWHDILQDPERLAALKVALCADLTELLHIPVENITEIETRSGSLVIDFTVRHSGELEDAELQELINQAKFSNLCTFYENVTFKKTYPITTAAQEAAYDRLCEVEQRRGVMPLSGMGVRQFVEDYLMQTGSEDAAYANMAEYCKPYITVAFTCEDYDERIVHLQPEMYVTFQELPKMPEETPEEVPMATQSEPQGLTNITGAAEEQTRPTYGSNSANMMTTTMEEENGTALQLQNEMAVTSAPAPIPA